MSHFAKVLDGNVVNVITAEADFFNTFIDTSPGTWIQTSYNTRGNVHYAPNSNTPDGGVALRGNYAGIGHVYDSVNDKFYTSNPYPSWTLSHTTWTWEAPTPYPTDGKAYKWNEETTSWQELSLPK